MLGYHSIQQMLSIKHNRSDFGRNSPLTKHRTSSADHLFTLHTAEHADHRVHSNSAREISRAFFAGDGVGRHVVLNVCYTKLS